MKIKNPDFKTCVQEMFTKANFVEQLGIKLKSIEPAVCEAFVDITAMHRQHLGRVHGGVITTLAGHAAGGAATSIIPADKVVVTPEFKINILRAINGNRLLCKAKVLKPGSKLIVTEAEVFDSDYDDSKLVAKAIFSFIVIPSIN